MSAANLHASAVAFGPSRGVLILGPSGAGKSRLALALIGCGAQLVADDQVFLAADNDALFARAPRSIEGLIEARGLGLVRLLARRLARIVVAVDLAAPAARMPDAQTRTLAGVTIECLPGRPDGSFARALTHYVLTKRTQG
ncbi:HPr kinase/phosphorylase [Pararhodobacter zhoushanensis]|uniref:HPr kinase/phosphatase C-terminal domain-containing protein n=1 Tax=Pararhodobacter zhoushanensis TaxID=2479545 RepID=A0ABT3H4U2_9RHOB|nr:HPr kinase/phosphatase C-terminal domain-containing protein [Pararhodobacter zhoushanensis]MCW1934710.1 HPr kinase/phosphatase C-terminal domain-containing protein [Pararhodobacter zhoushanensis]